MPPVKKTPGGAGAHRCMCVCEFQNRTTQNSGAQAGHTHGTRTGHTGAHGPVPVHVTKGGCVRFRESKFVWTPLKRGFDHRSVRVPSWRPSRRTRPIHTESSREWLHISPLESLPASLHARCEPRVPLAGLHCGQLPCGQRVFESAAAAAVAAAAATTVAHRQRGRRSM